MCTPLVTEEFCALETGQQPRRRRRRGGVTTDGMVVDFTGLSTEYRQPAPSATRAAAASRGTRSYDGRSSQRDVKVFIQRGTAQVDPGRQSLPPTFGGLCRQVSSSEVKYLKL